MNNGNWYNGGNNRPLDGNSQYRDINNYQSANYSRKYQERPNFSTQGRSIQQQKRQNVPDIQFQNYVHTSPSQFNNPLNQNEYNLVSNVSNPIKPLNEQQETFRSVKEEPNVKYTSQYTKYVQVCSNDRDSALYGKTNNFKICFEKIKNVIEIELVSAILPNQNDILDEPYLVIEIDELPSNIEFSCNNIKKAFAMLPLKKPNKDTASFIVPELGQNYKTTMKFKTPLASIQSFTLSIKDLNGNLFDFAPSDSSQTEKNLQTTFMFRVTSLEADMSSVQTRAIF
jgi:hypothetical protein